MMSSASSASGGRALRVDAAIALVVGFAASGIALFRIGAESVWLDEATSILYARQPFAELLGQAQDNGQPLYFLLLGGWIRLFGESETMVRTLSALVAVLAAVMLFVLARRLVPSGWAAVAAGLFVSHVMFVEFAQEARAYSLAMLAAVASSYAFIRLLDRPSQSHVAAYGVAAGVTAYVHFLLPLVIVGHAVYVFVFERKALRAWLPAFTLAALLWIPVVAYLVANRDSSALSWIPPLSGETVVRELDHLAGGTDVLLIATVAVVITALVAAISTRDRAIGIALTWVLVPIAALLAMSAVRPVWVARYAIEIVPGLALLVAALGARFAPGGLVLAGLMLALLLPQTILWYQGDHKPPWRDVVAYVLAGTQPGDSVLFYEAFATKPFDYYVRLDHAEARAPVSRSVDGAGDRLWLVLNYSKAGGTPPALRVLLDRIHRSYRQVRPDALFGPIKVRLYRIEQQDASAAPADARPS